MNKKKTISELKLTSLKVREHIIRMSTGGGCFTGASLSCTDLLVYLYFNCMNIHKNNLNDIKRDYLLLSKGHDVPALYGTLAEKGILHPGRLKNHLSTEDFIYWHPNTNIPGIEFHSGSLGHLISVASGIAYDCRLNKQNNKVFVILGDGELNEGSVWEGFLVAAAKQLDNLIAVVDRNYFQANLKTEDLIPMEPLEDKFRAFGWEAVRCNGHDFNELEKTFNKLPFKEGKPSVVIAETVRGKGLPSIEARADRWFCNFTEEEVNALIKELYNLESAELTSEILVVR